MDFGSFFGGLLQGGAQGYEIGQERKLRKEEAARQQEERAARIAVANAELKAREFDLQQQQELSARIKGSFRQALGAPPSYIGPPTEQQAPIENTLRGMGGAEELPMWAVPQAMDLQKAQQDQAYQDAMLGLRRTEVERAGWEQQPISPEAAGLLGQGYGSLPRGELSMVGNILGARGDLAARNAEIAARGVGGAGGAGGDAWSMENALNLFKAQPEVQQYTFNQGLGILMQEDPAVAQLYQQIVARNDFRPPSMAQMLSILSPEQAQRVSAYSEGAVQDLWRQSLNMGFPSQEQPGQGGESFQGPSGQWGRGMMPFSPNVPAGAPQAPAQGAGPSAPVMGDGQIPWSNPSLAYVPGSPEPQPGAVLPGSVPTMSGYYSPEMAQRENVLQQYPWLSQPQYDEPAPGMDMSMRDYVVGQILQGVEPDRALAKVHAAAGKPKYGGKGKKGGGGGPG